MLKIGQNWGKITNYTPNAQQRSAPLTGILLAFYFSEYELALGLCEAGSLQNASTKNAGIGICR